MSAAKPPKRPTPKERKQLDELLREPVCQPPGSLTVRFDKGPAPARALKALEVDDPEGRKLAEHLTKRRDEIIGRLAQDRDLAELLVNDPTAALKALDVPQELLRPGKRELLEQLAGRVRDVHLGFGTIKQVPSEPVEQVTPAQQQALQLLAATMDRVAAQPARSTEFTTAPRGLVTEAAQGGAVTAATPEATASIVEDVIAALDRAAGRVTITTPDAYRLDLARIATIPFRPRF